jgi:hypothetical protein
LQPLRCCRVPCSRGLLSKVLLHACTGCPPTPNPSYPRPHTHLHSLCLQGCAEIRWLATKMGGKAATISGLSGLGDIMLTCYGSLSRNRTVGVRLGRGERLADILASSSQVAEGVATAGEPAGGAAGCGGSPTTASTDQNCRSFVSGRVPGLPSLPCLSHSADPSPWHPHPHTYICPSPPAHAPISIYPSPL